MLGRTQNNADVTQIWRCQHATVFSLLGKETHMQHDVTDSKHTHMCPLDKVNSAKLPAADFINTKQLALGQHTQGFAVLDWQRADHAASSLIIRRCYIN